MAKKKTVPYMPPPRELTEMEKARKAIESELKLLYALLPMLDEAEQKKFDIITGSIDDQLDIVIAAEEDWRSEIKQLGQQLYEAKEQIDELEEEANEHQDPEEFDDALLLQVFGSNPIVCISQSVMDDQFLSALEDLTKKARPHELLELLKGLNNPRVAAELKAISELDAMLY